MSLLPLLLSSDWDMEPHHLLDPHIGLGVNPENLLRTVPFYGGLVPRERSRCPFVNYYRPWNELLRKDQGGSSTVKANKDKFEVVLDVQQFAPEEINVKVADRYVIVEGQHEEKEDEHGWISRKFTRKYMIPEQCDIDQVTSQLSSDGVLSITVPRKQTAPIEGEKMIQIEHTGKPAALREDSEKKSVEAKKES